MNVMNVMSENLMARLLDRVEHRFYGKYRALVVDNADPEKRGRLRLRVPSAMGNVVTGWALPCAPYGGHDGRGFFFIPEKDDGVWVEFEAGLLDFPVWVGTFWCKPGGTSEAPEPASTQIPPTSKMIKTGKHTIEFADEDGQEALRISDSNKNKVTLDAKGVVVEDGNGNKIRLEAGGVTVESPKIKLGAGALDAEKLVKGETLKKLLTVWHNLLVTHVHPTAAPGAPTLPSLMLVGQAPMLDAALSAKHVVE